jgi:hypothetical protein
MRGMRCATAAAAAVLSLCGCSSLSAEDVADAGAAFAEADGDPATQCELLLPNTRASLEEEESSPCEEAIGQVGPGAGDVTAVEVWGEEAQVRLTDDTLFLTRTDEGWRISAAACTPQGEDLPYDCQLEAS